MQTALSINLNKIALLRNSREGNTPSPTEFGHLCIEQGCQGLTVHPRPDMRHIRPDDIASIGNLCAQHKDVEFNIEGNPFAGAQGGYPGFIELVTKHLPDQVTLVPDTDSQLTSDHGFDLVSSTKELAPIVRRLKDLGLRISLFMDPDKDQIQLAKDIGADRIELYTGPYASSFNTDKQDRTFIQYRDAALFAQKYWCWRQCWP